jgi:UDP-N-acetylmuramyl tripeptide synthase
MALRVGGYAAQLARAVGFGGAVIGGRVALRLAPGILHRLATDRTVAMVSGTNGKTTTTAMLAAALRSRGAVATNSTGANMLDGMVVALHSAPAPQAVLEVDEMHLGAAARECQPNALVLLNVSRDQLDRVGELRRIAVHFQQVVRAHPNAAVIANADDPYVVFAARESSRVIWVAPGLHWSADSDSCPACGGTTVREGPGWRCTGCPLASPSPHWRLVGDVLHGPYGQALPVRPSLPGRANRANAAFAVAAAETLGVPAHHGAAAVGRLDAVAGRYQWHRINNHRVRTLLAKNPAGWVEMLDLLDGSDRPIVISINARQADGFDTSWLFDVPFERLRGRRVVAAGDRAADMAVRLTYADVRVSVVADPLQAVTGLPVPEVDLVGDYSSFRHVLRQLEEASDAE